MLDATPAQAAACRVRRRTALLAAAPLPLLAGCTFGSVDPTSGLPSESPELADQEFDEGLVADARVGIAALAALLDRTGKVHPALAATVRGLTAMHRAHDEVLAEAAAGSARPRRASAKVPADPDRALALVRTREAVLQRELVDLAVSARSGPLARLLASMSASVAQHLAALPTTAAEVRG